MARLTVKDIQIDMGFQIHILQTFCVETKVNCHGHLACTGILYPESGLSANTHSLANREVSVFVGGLAVLSAVVQRFEVQQENEVYHFSLYAMTSSILLDFEPLSYFYQNTRQTWAEMVRKSIRRANGECIATTGKEKIRIPILQYRETPWGFSRRMATQIGTVITVDSLSGTPSICLGIPNGQRVSINEERLVRNYGVLSSRRDALLRKDAAEIHDTYQVEDEQIFRLGDIVDTGSTQKPIISIKHVLNGDTLENHYTIADATTVLEEPWENEIQAGLMLNGTVIAVTGDQVKVCLSIPDDAEKERATWFDYAPVTNNGMYAMPPIGTGVALQWMSAFKGDCQAVRVVRNGAELTETYEHRALITEYDRHLHMGPDFLSFLSDGNTLIMRNGIRIKSGSIMKLVASKNIAISARKRIRIITPEEVFVSKTGVASSIWMKAREIHIKSSKTNVRSNESDSLHPVPYREPLKQVTLKVGTLTASLGAIPKNSGFY